jgi:hypothetical protein
MAGIISEGYESRNFSLSRTSERELIFDIQGTEDEDEVLALLEGEAPAAYKGLVIESTSADPIGGGIWKGRARYKYIESSNEYTFDTGGGTNKITQSISTVNSYPAPGFTAPNFKGAIGVSDDKVEGVDITTPKFEFSETHRFDNTFVASGYKVLLFQMTGKVNNSSFKGLAAGECLFLGASGTQRGDELWSITFKFSGSQNATGLTIGDITGIAKKGWEYLWVRYIDHEDTAAHMLIKKPVVAVVEQVYLTADFSTLGIGT